MLAFLMFSFTSICCKLSIFLSIIFSCWKISCCCVVTSLILSRISSILSICSCVGGLRIIPHPVASLLILLSFYCWFYGHSTTDCTSILLLVYSHYISHLRRNGMQYTWRHIWGVYLCPFYVHSKFSALYTFISCVVALVTMSFITSAKKSTTLLLEILLLFFWWFYSHSTDDSTHDSYSHSTGDFNPCCWWFYSHSTCFLLMFQLPFYGLFYSLVHCWDLWINSTDDSTPNLRIILLSFYRSFYSHSTGDFNPCCWLFYIDHQ